MKLPRSGLLQVILVSALEQWRVLCPFQPLILEAVLAKERHQAATCPRLACQSKAIQWGQPIVEKAQVQSQYCGVTSQRGAQHDAAQLPVPNDARTGQLSSWPE
jgi:hypothetical protein